MKKVRSIVNLFEYAIIKMNYGKRGGVSVNRVHLYPQKMTFSNRL